jgi:hypothetical protein
LKPCQNYLLKIANEFEKFKFTHMSRDKNEFADALATLALMTQVVTRSRIQPLVIKVRNLQARYCIIKETLDGESWYNDIKRFLQQQEYSQGVSKTYKKTLRRMTMNIYLDGENYIKGHLIGL